MLARKHVAMVGVGRGASDPLSKPSTWYPIYDSDLMSDTYTARAMLIVCRWG
jgi:hypothetical protein